MNDSKLVPAVQKAMEIIDLLAEYPERDFGVSEIASRFAFSKGTTHTILQTLAHYGMITRDEGTSRYKLGDKVFEIVESSKINFTNTDPFSDVAQIIRKHTNENINYSILSGDFNLVLWSVPAENHVLRVDLPIGSAVPAVVSSAGKVLVGDMDDKALVGIFERHHKNYTNNTIRSSVEFIRQVSEAKANGYASNNAEYEDGIFSVAAPVLNSRGKVVSAINIVAPNARYTPEFVSRAIGLVKWGALAISKRIYEGHVEESDLSDYLNG